MDQVEFTIVEITDFGTVARTVMPHINGRPLVDLAREVEAPQAAADNPPSPAGGYLGLASSTCAWPSRHFLGEPEFTSSFDSHTVLLGCDCGDVGCWPLGARVTVDEEHVEWSDFHQPHREHWDYTGLGPFRFNRQDYEQALRSI